MEEDDNREVLKPNFEHLKELYSLEQGKLHKMAHKLNERVLHPTSIEKTGVKLPDAAFHESTINSLNYYIMLRTDTSIFETRRRLRKLSVNGLIK